MLLAKILTMEYDFWINLVDFKKKDVRILREK